jgi:hypothetical protein
MKKCLLFHNWFEIDELYQGFVTENYNPYQGRIFRYCKRCKKWQEFIKLPYASDWYDCERPKPVIIAHQILRH